MSRTSQKKYAYATLLTLTNDKTHKFLVATKDSNLKIKFDGIVGSEFMKKFGVVIDYKQETFTMGDSVLKMDVKKQNIDFSTNTVSNLNDEQFSLIEYDVDLSLDESELPDEENEIKILSVEPQQDLEKLIKVPARSGIFAAVAVNRDGTGIISKFDLSEGIFMADSLVVAENNQANVAIINSLEEDVYIDIPNLKLEYYDERVEDNECIAQTAEMFNVNFCNREARLNEKLDFSHLNEREVKLLNPLINEFSDVFFLEGDMLSNKTLFEYEIKLKENA